MKKSSLVLSAALCCAVIVCEAAEIARTSFPYPGAKTRFGEEKKTVACVPAGYVTLTGGPLAERQNLNNHYIAYTIKPDRLLEPFRIQAGLPKKADRYDGWEDGELSGHAMGHYLFALAYVYELTKDPQALKQMEYVVDEIAKMQEADPDGYAFPVPKKTFTQLRENKVDAQPFKLNGIWSPFYSLHKLMAGLRDISLLRAHEARSVRQKARMALFKLGNFVVSVVSPLTPENTQKMLSCEFGGMDEVLADLTAMSGDKKFLECAQKHFYHEALMDPLSRKQDILTGRHGNTMIPEMTGMGRIYELTGDKKYRDIAEFFFDRVANHRSYATGGHGDGEYFFPVGDDAKHLSSHTTESCNCYNMLKLARLVFEWGPKASVMDFAERATLNHVASVIRPDREGAYCYFQPLASVAVKNFSTSEHVWTCCVGTGLENPGRYGELIAAGRRGEVYLNQFWDADIMLDAIQWMTVTGHYPLPEGVYIDVDITPFKRFSISGGFPYSKDVTVTFFGSDSYDSEFTLKIRKPYWSPNMTLKVNGEPVSAEAGKDGYIALKRKWKNEDTVNIGFDFSLRAVPMTDKPGDPLCLMYGPFVLAGVVPPDPSNPGARAWRNDGQSYETPPVMVAENVQELLSKLTPADGFAHFKSGGLIFPKDLEFRPLMDIMDEHYAVYFNRFSKAQWDAEGSDVISRVRLEMGNSRRLVDEITPGYQQSEIDHKVVTGNTQARAGMDGRRFRFAPAGTSFEYTVSNLPSGEPLELTVEMSGRNAALKIVCGGREIFSGDVNTERGQSVGKTVPIPADAIAADGTAKLVFSGANGKASPQITKIRIMRRTSPPLK